LDVGVEAIFVNESALPDLPLLESELVAVSESKK
jgi:hypothetical protein